MRAGSSAQDRRVQKTQKLLRDALASLIAEKPYDAIVVKEILDRANVGRSTFYTHFRDKDDLLISGIHDMIRPVHSLRQPHPGKRHELILSFSFPIFEYHYQHRHLAGDRMGTRGKAILHEHLRMILADVIEDMIGRDSRAGRKSRRFPVELLADYVASTFVLVLNWWAGRAMPLPPKEINDLFHTLIMPSLARAWE
jgi:AcrR family transcriptional regulator